MRNGIADSISLFNICKSIDKVIAFRKMYSDCSDSIQIDEKLSLEFSKRFKVCYICINEKRAIKYNYGNLVGMIRGGISGLSLGVLKSYVTFCTTDELVTNKKFIEKVEAKLELAIPLIEDEMKLKSKKQWDI